MHIRFRLRLFVADGLLFVGVYAAPPVDALYAHARDEQIKQIARRVKTSTRASIVVGDFNATPWSRPLLGLLKEADLKNACS
jgi:endonuclease/exonuclease/phosphatase (EEP) superfamily protein YafD